MANNLRAIEVQLEEPVKIKIGTEQQERDEVTLIAASAKHRKLAGRLKRICQSTMIKSARDSKDLKDSIEESKDKKEEKEEKDFDVSWQDIINMLASAEGEFDLFDDVYDTFMRLLEAGCGNIDGAKITPHIFEQFSFEDVEMLLGEYCVNFLLTSLRTKKDGTT